MLMIFCVVLSLILIFAVVTPFFWGQGDLLQAASSENSRERLTAMKQAILKRYVEDEAAFEKKLLSKRIWEQRRQFLANRYVDAARRLDYVKAGEEKTQS